MSTNDSMDIKVAHHECKERAASLPIEAQHVHEVGSAEALMAFSRSTNELSLKTKVDELEHEWGLSMGTKSAQQQHQGCSAGAHEFST